nr:DUF4393 domain-containing protein [Desulfobacula sp.]
MPDEINLVKLALDSKIVEKVYDDGISPGMKEASKIPVELVKVAHLVLAPIQLLGALQDRFERIVIKISGKVSPENLTKAPTNIAGPILENLRYSNDDSIITECFINLLAKAIDKTKQDQAHPGFIKTLENLSPDEVLLIYVLSKKDLEIVDTMDLDRAQNQFKNLVQEKSDVPVNELQYPSNFEIYYTHLDALGIVTWPVYKQVPIMDGNVQKGIRRYSKLTLTPYGKYFVKACVPDDEYVQQRIREIREES